MGLTANGTAHTETEAIIREVAAAHTSRRGPLLEILHDVQDRLGCVPPGSVQVLADALNLSQAEVHGVVTFYHDFRSVPAGRTTVRVCEAEACQSVGSRDVVARLKEQYGVAHGETTPDGSLTAERVFCFGNCALGPTVEVNGKLHGRVDPDRLCSIVDKELGR
ncbi:MULTISPECIES: NAD(P)H-dependent oxidoreductase subunit E [unclassified Nocardioides]|uniref:NAD(P)H-dependent oxidoreductase subunit E n=1 Tax=unclassified Nocardioides TaxID=2615069 RepID=UPI003610B665